VGAHPPVRRVVVVDADEAGSAVIKNMVAGPELLMDPVAVVDGDRAKHGTGYRSSAPSPSSRPSWPSATLTRSSSRSPRPTRQQISRVVDICAGTNVPFRIAPDPE
jgi:hypothetical protein